MPYKKFICYKDGQKRWCTKNLRTGQIVRYTSPENRESGIRIREAFAHGFTPTRVRKYKRRSPRGRGHIVRSHTRK